MISLIYNVRIMQKHNLLQTKPRGIYITFWNVILSPFVLFFLSFLFKFINSIFLIYILIYNSIYF